MKKSLFFGLFFCFALIPNISFSQTAESQNKDPFQNPYSKTLETRAFKKMKEAMLKDKEKIMDSLNKIQKYTEEEYQTLYNNYEVNPPFIEKDGILDLNPDYISKNTKYIEKDGVMVKNENYKEVTNKETYDWKKLMNTTPENKRLGKKSYPINPDAFF